MSGLPRASRSRTSTCADPAQREALADTLDAYQALINEAVALADEAQHESTQLGCMKLRFALLAARLGLCPGIGLVPSEIERARLEADFSQVARQMLHVLQRHGVPEHVLEEVIDTVEGRLPTAVSTISSVGVTANGRHEVSCDIAYSGGPTASKAAASWPLLRWRLPPDAPDALGEPTRCPSGAGLQRTLVSRQIAR